MLSLLLLIMVTFCGGNPKSLSGIYVIERRGALNGSIIMLEFFSDGKYTSDKSNYYRDYSIDGDLIWLERCLFQISHIF